MENSQIFLNNIYYRVNKELKNNQNLIVLGVFKYLLKKHNNINCNCNYCELLPRYINLKKMLNRSKKSFYDKDRKINIITSSLEDIEALKRRVKQFKLNKDSLKLI